jgi:hypothetical protein
MFASKRAFSYLPLPGRAAGFLLTFHQTEPHTLTLNLPTTPYWLNLPRGVRVEIKPVTTAAQVAAARNLGALRAAKADLAPDTSRGLSCLRVVSQRHQTRFHVARPSRMGRAASYGLSPARSVASVR